LNGAIHIKEPASCTAGEIQDFARLVREGFRGSDEGLLRRIESARLLAFHYAIDGSLSAVAALKMPGDRQRDDVFEKASVSVGSAGYQVELGWVYVVPSHRGSRLSEDLCGQLLAGDSGVGVYATTRSNNVTMIDVLRTLGFERVGDPYPHRGEELVVFLRS